MRGKLARSEGKGHDVERDNQWLIEKRAVTKRFKKN